MVGFDYQKWKKEKISKGKWLSKKDYKNKKKKRKDYKFIKSLIRDTERKIFFDTETTGLTNSDKIVEICLWETINDIKTDNYLHFYFNPQQEIPPEVVKIHGLNNDFLKDKPLFSEKCQQIIDFIGDSNLVAHNASFDRRMLNNELARLNKNIFAKHKFIDTLKISRFLFPKEKNNQDALCQRFNILQRDREIHTAKGDVELLYKVYLNLKDKLKGKNVIDFFLY